jgi:hypothetical protein
VDLIELKPFRSVSLIFKEMIRLDESFLSVEAGNWKKRTSGKTERSIERENPLE